MRREADFPGEPTTIGELMRTPQTTPTRDEAVLDDIVQRVADAIDRATVGYSMRLTRLVDEKSTYTLTYDDGEKHEFDEIDDGYAHIKQRKLRAQAAYVIEALASAPAPASGGVDADVFGLRVRCENRRKLGNFDVESDEENEHLATLTVPLLMLERVLASLSPAATPVSEAGGERVRAADEAEHFIQAAIDSAPEPLRRLGEWLANKLDDDDWKTADRLITGAAVSCASLAAELDQAAGVISDQNAALAKPASSPAGGDVVQTLIDKTEKLIEAADDMGWSCNSSSADQAIREAKDAVRAALSQSTSPDNDPTASGETVGSFRDRGPVATNPPGRGGRDQNSTSGEAGE